jgi:iron complex outermembrane receptor protein
MKERIAVLSALLALLAMASPGFAADPTPLEMDQIVVTATRTGKNVLEAPAATVVVTAEEIEESNTLTIDEAVNDVSGVFDRRGKGLMDTQASVSIRGIPGQQRNLVLMDGITLNRAYDGTVSFGAFPPENVERVEIAKGPFSSLYGGYAMGGVMNIITKMPEKREFTIKGRYGSDNLYGTYLSFGDKFKDALSLFFSFGYQSTDGYVTDYDVQSSKPPAGIHGWSPTTNTYGALRYLIGNKGDNGWWDRNITAKAAYRFSEDSRIRITYVRSQYEYTYGDPNTYLANTAGEPVYAYGTVREGTFLGGPGGKTQNIYDITCETAFDTLKTRFSLSLNDYEDSWYVTPGTTAKTTRFGGPGTGSFTPSRAYESNLVFDMPLFDRHRLTFGAAYKYDRSNTKEHTLLDWKDEDSTTNLTYESRGRAQTFALFAEDEIKIVDRLKAYIGFREDWWGAFDGYANDVGKKGYPRQYASTNSASFSPRGALVYNPLDRTALRLSMGKAFRPPTIYELYRTWTSQSGITYAGNPSLKPETSVSWDIGGEHRVWAGGAIKAAYFESYIEDMIYSRDITSTYKDKINVGKAEVRGFEIEGSQRFDIGLKVFANYTYYNAKMRENDEKPETEGERLTFVPREMFNIGAEIDQGPVTVHAVGRYVGKRYSDDLNRDRANNVYLSYDPYFVVDAKLLVKVLDVAVLSFAVDNIFDRDYFSSYKAPGRKLYGELTLKF